MMERMVLDKLEARRMVFVDSYVRNMSAILSFHLQYQTEKKEEKRTYHPPSPSSPIPTPIPTNPSHHRKNSIQHHNPH